MRWSLGLAVASTVLAAVLAIGLAVVLALRLQASPERPAVAPDVVLTVTPVPTLPPSGATPVPEGQLTPAAANTPAATPGVAAASENPDPVGTAIRSIVQVRTERSLGTGFVWARRGDTLLVVTAAHVLEDAWSVSVIAPDGIEYRAAVLRTTSALDAALLAVNRGPALEPLPIADSTQLALGDPLYVVGFALGTELLGDPTVTRGVLSGRRTVDGVDYLQTDAAVNPGNSGGPVLDNAGRVVGMAVGAIRSAQGVSIEGLGFALAIEELVAFVEG